MLELVEKSDFEKLVSLISELKIKVSTLENRVANMDKQLQDITSLNKKYGPIDPYTPPDPLLMPWIDTYPPKWTSPPVPLQDPTFPPYTVTCNTKL